MLSLLVALTLSARANDCLGEPVSAQQVNAFVEDAVLAFATLDEEGFYSAADQAGASLPCLSEPFLLPYAASYHRLVGMRATYDGQGDAAILALRAAVALEADHVFSAKLAPEGGKLHRAYAQAKAAPGSLMVPIQAPGGLTAWVDGVQSKERPANVPAVIQFAQPGGTVLWSAYVPAGGHVPATLVPPAPPAPEPAPEAAPEAAPEPVAVITPAPEPARVAPPEPARTPTPIPLDPLPAPEPRGAGLWAGAATTGVLTAALAGSAVYFRTRFDDDPTAMRYHATNGSYYGAIGVGVLTVGLLGAAAAGGGQ